MDLHFAWQAWHLWHLVGNLLTHNFLTYNLLTHGSSLCVAGVARRGTYGTGLALVARLVPRLRWDAAAFCVAGVALCDIHLHFVWQAWHLSTHGSSLCVAGVALVNTWIVTLRGRRGTYGTGLAPVARLVPRGGVVQYMHTYIHTYIQTYIHTYIHTYMHTYMHACMHTCMHNLLISVYTWMLLRKSWRCLRRLDVIGLVCSVLFI